MIHTHNNVHHLTDSDRRFGNEQLTGAERQIRRRETARKAAKIAVGALLALGFGKVAYGVLESDRAETIWANERATIDSVVDNGGKFYMGKLSVKPDGIVREQPAVMNFTEATSEYDVEYENVVEDRPEGLEMADPIVVTNEEGTWFGFPRESDKEDEPTTAYLWVHADHIEGKIDADQIASFGAGENPNPTASKSEPF